jgi:hypothetical protein
MRQPYTLTSKCLELFHWRHATYRNRGGELQIDETKVEGLVQAGGREHPENHVAASKSERRLR